jgi:hypothetical protein
VRSGRSARELLFAENNHEENNHEENNHEENNHEENNHEKTTIGLFALGSMLFAGF